MKQGKKAPLQKGSIFSPSKPGGAGWPRLERRDQSSVGQRRRALFAKLQAVLEREGLAEAAAREAVYNTLKGRAADTIAVTEGAELLWRLLDVGDKQRAIGDGE